MTKISAEAPASQETIDRTYHVHRVPSKDDAYYVKDMFKAWARDVLAPMPSQYVTWRWRKNKPGISIDIGVGEAPLKVDAGKLLVVYVGQDDDPEVYESVEAFTDEEFTAAFPNHVRIIHGTVTRNETLESDT